MTATISATGTNASVQRMVSMTYYCTAVAAKQTVGKLIICRGDGVGVFAMVAISYRYITGNLGSDVRHIYRGSVLLEIAIFI